MRWLREPNKRMLLPPDKYAAAGSVLLLCALLWWPDDTHWNGAGQRAAARAVYHDLLR